MKIFLSLLICLVIGTAVTVLADDTPAPVRFAVIGLVHDHAKGFIPGAITRPDVKLVGIVETNPKLIAEYTQRYHLDTNLFFASVEELFAKTKPQAVALFNSTFDHKRLVEECAPHGVPIMMEKPLAVSMEHARAMAAAAKKANIPLIVNYETTWYAGNHAAYELVCSNKVIDDIRKMVVHDGHWGPKELGCSPEFLEWLTDPILNGGGALMDFGCYGADLMTWLMQGERPTSVTAVTQHIKPEVYPRVEDEATIVLTYPKATGIIEASWNWPYNRKDLEIYGQTGSVLVPKNDTVRVIKNRNTDKEMTATAPALEKPESDSLSYLAAVVRGEIKPAGLSSLEVNMTVVEILDAARKSAETGKRVDLPVKAPY